MDLAKKVVETIKSEPSEFKPIYNVNLPIKEKIETIAREIYGADGVTYTATANRQILNLDKFWGLINAGVYGELSIRCLMTRHFGASFRV